MLTVLTVLLVGVGAAIGAPLRYLVGRALPTEPGGFPRATFSVNVVGSFLLGLVAALYSEQVLDSAVAAGLAAGFCGALTTYSTLALETLRLAEAAARATAAVYVVASVAAGLVAVALGWSTGSWAA